MDLRPELPPMPDRIARLPRHRGYPVPWFVVWLDADGEPVRPGTGTPDFRIVFPDAIAVAHNGGRCWVCGETLGAYKAFTVGPMCAVNRTSAEPPSHRDCADWSARACPFLSRPHARRRDVEIETQAAPGIALLRNPGVALVWVTRGYHIKRDPNGGALFEFHDPTEVLWYAEGRPATRAEVQHSIDTGLPALRDVCDTDSDHRALDRHVDRAMPLLPA